VGRPPTVICFDTTNSLPVTQGQRWKDANSHCRCGYAEKTVKYWDNSTEPERLLTNMMNKLEQSQDNVVFSTKDL
jgi:hypothetical protein